MIVAALPSMRIAMACVTRGILMMHERHALRGGHGSHALNGHGNSDDESKKADQVQGHDRIVSHELGRTIASQVPVMEPVA